MSRRSVDTLVLLVSLVIGAAGCSTSQTPPPPPGSSPGSSPGLSPGSSPGPALSQAALRIRLVDQLGPLWYCDPDFYPVARADEAAIAMQRFGEVQADKESFEAILGHVGIGAGAAFTPAQKLAIYQAWKQLLAINLDPAGDGAYRFDYINMPAAGATEGRRTTGTIDPHGTIAIEQQAAAGEPPCPICLARGTRIATPDGEVAIEDIRVGMRVWSMDQAGNRIVATVARTGQTPVPATHEVVRLILDDGRVVRASPGHPLADGRKLGAIRAGDRVDGATVVSATLERYDGGFTFDLRPDGPTGVYFADGVPLGSTISGG